MPIFNEDYQKSKRKLNTDIWTKHGQDVFYKTEIGLKNLDASNNDYHMFTNFKDQV